MGSKMTASEWVKTNGGLYTDRARLSRDCAAATGKSGSTVRKAIRDQWVRKTKHGPTGRQVKGAVDIDEHLRSVDPKELLLRGLSDLGASQIVSDQAMYAHVRDNYGPVTKDAWSALKRMDQFSRYQHRVGGSVRQWGHPKAIDKLRAAQFKYA